MTTPITIGVFDSGVGGLTVYKELLNLLPEQNYIYIGDTARVPYGIRSPETIRKYALQNCLFLIEKGAQLIVVACNTATASALSFLQSILKVPVIGVIEPGVEAALAATKNKRIGIIGTETTIRSQVYEKELKAKDNQILCYSQPTPLFVPLVEEFLLEDKILKPVFDHYLHGLNKNGIDTLVLGCTHYPVLQEKLGHYFKEKVNLVDSALVTAKTVQEFIKNPLFVRHSHQESDVAAPKETTIYVTDSPERIHCIAENILPQKQFHIEKIDL